MKKMTFVLDNVRSAFNVGAIFRTADGLNCDIHLIGITPLPGKDKKLEKTSLNSLEYVKWQYFQSAKNWFDFISSIKEERMKSLIISVEEGRNIPTVSLFGIGHHLLMFPFDHIYIILGHEINGIADFLVDVSDFVIKLPMEGKKNSLNVSTCAGIVGYRIKEYLSCL